MLAEQVPLLFWSLPLTKSTPCEVLVPEGLVYFYSLHSLGSLAGTQGNTPCAVANRNPPAHHELVDNSVPIKSLTADPLDRVPEDGDYGQIGQPLRSLGQRE